ncbi:MAG: EAL domain-containing protein [Cyanobacteria bacterium Co-bin13]|nr:EAL domain-containing protein [Cyanobacteria bacterium Co-bin13]
MEKILVIGQESKSRKAILRLLVSEGFEAITADDTEAGIQTAQSERPDLLVSTLDIDGSDSRTLLTSLKQRSELAIIPFILVTNQGEKFYLRECIELGADDCLVEPVTDPEIVSAIKTRLQKQAQITEQYVAVLRNTAERLNRLAHYDSLTDLPNHHLLHQRLVQAIERCSQTHQSVALLSLSLDRLRQVNNTLGYQAGDALLQATARRLRASLPEGSTVARLTGNQFAVLLTDFTSRQAVLAVAQDLINRLSQPFSLPSQEVFLTTSIGIALYPEDSADISTLLRQADAALEWAKQQKSNSCQFYRIDIPVVPADQIVLETWLRYALERDEFEVYYQPQMGLGDHQILGAEALIRWSHPEHGPISPAQFIPLAEETGLIVPIGEWMLQQTCRQVKLWQQQGLPPLQVSVNLSSVQFNQPHLGQTIATLLEQAGLASSALELEITETALMQDAAAAIAILSDLKAQGFKIAIDDFGTGYSSLSYLKQFPIDTLKIDTCFVRGVTTDPKNRAILTAVIQMAHDLQLTVIAEGVELEAELALLESYRCDIAQGYYIGRPMPAEQFEAFLTSYLAKPGQNIDKSAYAHRFGVSS